jgi:hypothetical protein
MENTNTQTKTFDFYKDEKCTIWTRAKFQIEAETYEQAVKMVKEMEENNEWDIVDIRYEDMPETLEVLTPEENQYNPTVEIYSEDTNELILDNDPRIPQTK